MLRTYVNFWISYSLNHFCLICFTQELRGSIIITFFSAFVMSLHDWTGFETIAPKLLHLFSKYKMEIPSVVLVISDRRRGYWRMAVHMLAQSIKRGDLDLRSKSSRCCSFSSVVQLRCHLVLGVKLVVFSGKCLFLPLAPSSVWIVSAFYLRAWKRLFAWGSVSDCGLDFVYLTSMSVLVECLG